MQIDLWNRDGEDAPRWAELRDRVRRVGLRNSLLVAIAPTATIASIVGAYECIEPQVSNLFKRETLSGEFLQVNRFPVNELKALGLWTEAIRNRIKLAEGSVQGIEEIPAGLRRVFRTVWEIPMRSLIDMAADRAPFIDQSQSLNLFAESPTIGKMSSMYTYAWKRGLKTTYYLRSRPATGIAKTTVTLSAATPKTSPARWRIPNPANRASDHHHLLLYRNKLMMIDPGMDLTPRPMRYPAFFEMYKAAIKNIWTVEEVDFSTDLSDLDRRVTPAERHLIQRLVTFFATGDSTVGNNPVLNLYQHVNPPEARMYLSRRLSRGGAARPVLPDPARQLPAGHGPARAGLRRDQQHPLDQAQGRLLLPMDGLDPGLRPPGDARAPSTVPLEPDLLRRLHRGALLLRGIRLRLLPAVQGPAPRPGDGHELGLPRRERTSRSPST